MAALNFQVAGWWAHLPQQLTLFVSRSEDGSCESRGKGRSQRGRALLSNASFPLRFCGQQGHGRCWAIALLDAACGATHRSRFSCWFSCRWCETQGKCPCSCWCQHVHHVVCLRCESDTHILLPYNLLPLNNISKRICFIFIFPIDVCDFSAERRCVYEL